MGLRGWTVVAVGTLVIVPLAVAQQAAAPQTTPQQAATQGAAQAAVPPVKIGFVDVERAVVSIDEGKAKLKELQDWAKPRRDALEKLGNDIQALQQELASKRGVASDDALDQLNKQLVAKQRQFEDMQRDAKRDFDEKQNAVLKDLGQKLNDVIAQYADSNRFTAIFILKPNDVAYLANSADITPTVIKLYNEKYPYQPKTAATGK